MLEVNLECYFSDKKVQKVAGKMWKAVRKCILPKVW